MMQEEHKQIVKDLLERFNQGKLDGAVGELIDPKMVFHHHGHTDGPEVWMQQGKDVRVSFPDARNDIISQTMEGDKLVTLYEFSGTHLAPFGKFPPSGKSFRVEGKLVSKMKDGRLIEADDSVDEPALMQQLGMME